jgi:hypothetical protein
MAARRAVARICAYRASILGETWPANRRMVSSETAGFSASRVTNVCRASYSRQSTWAFFRAVSKARL